MHTMGKWTGSYIVQCMKALADGHINDILREVSSGWTSDQQPGSGSLKIPRITMYLGLWIQDSWFDATVQ